MENQQIISKLKNQEITVIIRDIWGEYKYQNKKIKELKIVVSGEPKSKIERCEGRSYILFNFLSYVHLLT